MTDNRLGRGFLRWSAVAIFAAAGALINIWAVQPPAVELGDGPWEFIAIGSPEIEAEYRVTLELEASGRVTFAMFVSGLDEPTPAGSIPTGSVDISKIPLPDVVFTFGCGAEIDPASFVRQLDSSSEFAVTVTGGDGPCPTGDGVQLDDFQTMTIAPAAGNGFAEFGFSLQPRDRWVAATLDRRIARMPIIRYDQPLVASVTTLPSGEEVTTSPVFPADRVTIRASIAAQPGEAADLVEPDPESGSILPGETPTWTITDDAIEPYVRWVNPGLQPLSQFLLVFSGVLLGIAASLAVEFLVPSRVAAKAEASAEASIQLQAEAVALLSETRRLLEESDRDSSRSWWAKITAGLSRDRS